MIDKTCMRNLTSSSDLQLMDEDCRLPQYSRRIWGAQEHVRLWVFLVFQRITYDILEGGWGFDTATELSFFCTHCHACHMHDFN